MLYLLKTRIKYEISSDEFEKICTEVAEGQKGAKNWIWKIWGHNPDEKIVEITYLIDNEKDLEKGVQFIESMNELYHFIVESVTHEEFEVMMDASNITSAPIPV